MINLVLSICSWKDADDVDEHDKTIEDLCTDSEGSPGLCHFQRYDNENPTDVGVEKKPIPSSSSKPPSVTGGGPLPSVKLPTIGDGCGKSIISHKRIVGGVPAKLGKRKK